jgi:murein DD-endopeptidase MepM/ murein hydrolase activator NlpD
LIASASNRIHRRIIFCLFGLLAQIAGAQTFHLPTANYALFEPGGAARFFVGTAGKEWSTGCFGCVRTDGWQLHEVLDIRALQRDKRGEPADAVMATADGEVVYLNTKPSLSNYGNYIVLRHRVEGLEIYSLYAHLSRIQPGLKVGQPVKAGQVIAIMGRTSNTGEAITKDRAHVHFELNLFINDRFEAWYKKTFPNQHNDHKVWNGYNMAGLDPSLILLGQQRQGANFGLLRFIQKQTELCRVQVRATDFQWLKRYPQLVRPNPPAQKDGVAGYEIVLNYNAVAFELIPRAESEMKGKTKIRLLSVNEAEQQKNPCRRLVTRRSGRWELTESGMNALRLLTY